MSFDFNYKFWIGTKKDLDNLIKRQDILKRLKPISNPVITYKIFSELYVLYVELVNKLGYVYHHTLQVQKREVVRVLVESATKRLIELKNELKQLELSEYVYTDKALITRKLTPYDLVIWRSPQFLFRRPLEIQNIVYENQIFMDNNQKEEKNMRDLEKLNDTVTLIQAHERARSARAYKSSIKYDKKNLKITQQKRVDYKFSHKADQAMSIPVKRTLFNAYFVKPDESCRDLLEVENLDTKSIDEIDLEELQRMRERAAIIMQSAWRAHKSKEVYKKKFIFKQMLYGMKNKRKVFNPHERTDSVIEMYKNEMLKQKLDEDFLKLITDERTRLLQQRSPWIMEDISDHIRAWFREFYDKVGDFHPYPEVLKSGTVLVLIDETMTPMEFSDYLKHKGLSKEEKKKLAEKRKLKKRKEKEMRRKEKIKEAKRRKKMKAAGIVDIAHGIITNKNIAKIEKTIKQYSLDWRLVDEYLNKNHEAIKEWVTEGELAIIHKELRILVDEFMRIEYELLRKELAAELKKKYKPTKQKKPKKKKGKKKKRKTQDITADRTLQSLYDELKDAGIIENFVAKSFADYIAEFNFIADDTRDEDRLTTLDPSKGDIKMVVQECMLGMGEFAIDKPKSLYIIGPLNNGKKLLCNIIASELDAVFLNLSPEKIYKYSDNLNYLLHVIMKVAKAFQPTILFINDVHRVFWKKIPPDQAYLNPTLLQKPLMKKIMKPIKKDDKILVLGTSDTPWAARASLKRVFQKVILIPKSDYGTSFLLWLDIFARYVGDNTDDYIVSALAKVFQKFNSGDVTDNAAETLNVRRRMRLQMSPLNPSEFLNYFVDLNVPIFPPEDKILEKYNKWFSKSNKLMKERIKLKKEKAKKGSKKK